jgi:hypothetical protein
VAGLAVFSVIFVDFPLTISLCPPFRKNQFEFAATNEKNLVGLNGQLDGAGDDVQGP